MTGRIGGTPTRRIAELLAMPTTKGSCYVPSPRSPLSGPFAGRAAKGMRFRVRALHALVACSLDGSEAENWIVGGFLQCVLQSSQSAEISVRAPFLQFFPCSPSVTRSVLVPRPAARRCSASSPSGLGFQQQISRAKNALGNFLPEPPQKAHLGLGSGAHSRRFAQECPE